MIQEIINILYGMKADNLNLDDLHTKDKYEALDMAIKDLEKAPKSPCDLCKYNPPGSGDGKPCTMCPAESGVTEQNIGSSSDTDGTFVISAEEIESEE